MTATNQPIIVILPTAIEYFGDITGDDYESCLAYNAKKCEEAGLQWIANVNHQTDCAHAIYANTDAIKWHHRRSDGIIVTDLDGNELEVNNEIISDIWEGLGEL
jgi:hypothetical protein